MSLFVYVLGFTFNRVLFYVSLIILQSKNCDEYMHTHKNIKLYKFLVVLCVTKIYVMFSVGNYN